MAAAGLEEVETYVLSRQDTISQYIATHTLLKLCLAAERQPEARIKWRWRDKEGIDTEGVRAAARVTQVELEA